MSEASTVNPGPSRAGVPGLSAAGRVGYSVLCLASLVTLWVQVDRAVPFSGFAREPAVFVLLQAVLLLYCNGSFGWAAVSGQRAAAGPRWLTSLFAAAVLVLAARALWQWL